MYTCTLVYCVVSVTGSVPVYQVDSLSVQGKLVLVHRKGTSKRSTVTENPTNSTFMFTHADVVALRVEYHAPATWQHLKANSERRRRRETIRFRLTADGVQPAHDSFHVDVVDAASRTTRSIRDGDDVRVTAAGNRSTLIAAAVTSGLAVTAAVFAVVGVVVTVFRRRRRSAGVADKSPTVSAVSAGDKVPADTEVRLPEVVLVAVSNLPPPTSDAERPAVVVREQIRAADWSRVDPEILQHCRTTDPILSEEKIWV